MTWKRYAALFLSLCLALSLSACQDNKQVYGLVTEIQTDEAGNLTAFVVEDEGERTGVLLAEKTALWPRGSGSWTQEELRQAFQADFRVDVLADAWCYPRREKLTTADGGEVRAYWATNVQIDGELRREALTLRDGTPVDVLEWDAWAGRIYRLADGTELLQVSEPSGPENSYVATLESFDDLSEMAKEKVRRWYEDRGALYDEEEELERSYAAYRELGVEFDGDLIQQETSPASSSETVMYFLTSLLRPQENGQRTSYELQLGEAFDRETGEKFSNWDLFAVPEAEVRRRLPELCGWVEDEALRKAMETALEADWIVFFPEHLSVSFPPGTLPGEEYSQIISVDYQDIPEGFLQPWAISAAREE